MRKFIILIVCLLILSACSSNYMTNVDINSDYTKDELYNTLIVQKPAVSDDTAGNTGLLETKHDLHFDNDSYQTDVSYINTTSDMYLSQNNVIKKIMENPDILGGMYVDLNSDNIDEIIFIINTPMGKMYTINYFSNNEIIEIGEIYYWGHWLSDDEMQPEIKIYMNNNTIFYCTERIYSIKDVVSAIGIEMTAYYQLDNQTIPYEINILSYVNTDCSDEVILEMNKIFNRTKNNIENNCMLLKTISLEMQWTRDELLEE